MNVRYGVLGLRCLLLVNLSATTIFACIGLLFAGRQGMQSAVLGCLVYLIPNLCYAKKVFQYQGALAAKQIVNSFYKGEALKIGLSIILFTLVFAVFKLIPLIFFGVYISMQMLVWFTPLMFI